MDPRGDLLERILMHGEYERTITANIQRYLGSQGDYVDVGANVGFYSVMFAKQIPHTRVLAIEPMPEAITYLRRNLELNDVADRIFVHSGAVGAVEETRFIKHIPGKVEYATLADLVHPSISSDSSSASKLSIHVETLDNVIERYGVTPSFIKIDVEGFESSVLAGSKKTIDSFHPVLLVEAENTMLRSANSSVAELQSILESHGYAILDAETLDPWRLGTPATNMLCLPGS